MHGSTTSAITGPLVGVSTDNHRVLAPLNHDISAVVLTVRDNMIHNYTAVVYLPRAAAPTWK